MTHPVLVDIVRICLGLEQKANTAYSMFSQQSDESELKTFWQSMADEESRHERYWTDLLAMAVTSELPLVLDEPEQVLEQLRLLDKTMSEMTDGSRRLSLPGEMFLMANHLEYCMLHPALAILFHFIKKTAAGSTSPEEEYEQHLDQFEEAFLKHTPAKSEALLIGTLVRNLWRKNREYATQLGQIHMLRRLIPICASCKKIRDDKGHWRQLETYFHEHADVEFTHGMCPACVHRLYGK
jgi:hypothetical protein